MSVLHVVQTGSVSHPASYPMGTGGSFLGVKRPGRETDHLPPTSVAVDLYIHSAIRLHDVVLNELSTGQLYLYLRLIV
jgi:hypothetical protein